MQSHSYSSTPRAKNILYCESNLDGTIGGSFYSLLFLLDGLDKTRYHPIVVFYRDNALVSRYRDAGIDVRIFSLPHPIHLPVINPHHTLPGKILNPIIRLVQKTVNFFRFFIAEGVRKARFIRQEKVELIHLNNSIIRNHDWMLAALLTRTPFITHERGINQHYPKLARLFSRQINAIICISRAVSETLIKAGFPKEKLVTIYNGIDPDDVTPSVNPEVIRERHKIPPNQPVIGIVGNIKEWKGQESVINAVHLVRNRYKDITCLLVGDNAEEDAYYLQKLNRLITESGLDSNIIFTGYQRNVADYLNAMDIVIHASILPEPFGRVLIEAMAMHKPLIASNDGAVPEIVQNGISGITFPPGNADELANAIIHLLDNPDIASKMGESGYERLITMFHIDENARKTQSLYDQFIN